jgi:5-methylcytosine-specific restriction endonuclease McrA
VEELRGKIARLGNAQGWLCFHCGKPMEKHSARKLKSGSYDNGYTKEHVVPRKLGGRNSHVVLAHLPCNSKRGHEAPAAHMMARATDIWRSAGVRVRGRRYTPKGVSK